MENQKKESEVKKAQKLHIRKRLWWEPEKGGIPFTVINGSVTTMVRTFEVTLANPADLIEALVKGDILSASQVELAGDKLSIRKKKGHFPEGLKVVLNVTGKIDTHTGKAKTIDQTYALLGKCGLLNKQTELVE